MNPFTSPQQPAAASGMDPMLVLLFVVAALVIGGLIAYMYVGNQGRSSPDPRVMARAKPKLPEAELEDQLGLVFADAVEKARKQAVLAYSNEMLKTIGKRLAKPTIDLLPTLLPGAADAPATVPAKPTV